jgi:hypothetical protein
MTYRHILVLLGLSLLLTASECVPPGDDDDDASDDDDDDNDAAGDDDVADDDDIVSAETTISGVVVAVDRATGLELSPSAYAGRAGGMIVYALPDAGDLSSILGKDTMTGPGDYSISIAGYVGPLDVVVVVDEDGNHFIDSGDVARGYAFNPLAAAGSDLEDIDLVIDLAPHAGGGGGGGGGGGCDQTLISGTVVLDGLPDGAIGISTNNAALTAGPWHETAIAAAGAYSLGECTSREVTAVLGFLDADDNGYFEPSDPLGGASSNPVPLTLGDSGGNTITIPDDTLSAPTPPAYVAVAGTVVYDDFSTGDILVRATHITTDGYLFSQVTLAAPGAFSLLAPAHTEGVLVWAVLDDDGDGEADPGVDPSDSEGPLEVGSGVSGIALELGPATLGSVSGTIDFAGGASAGDTLHVAVFASDSYDPSDGPPVATLEVLNPALPYDYTVTDLQSGTYWVGAYLDIGGDNPNGAGPEDPDAQTDDPVLLAPGGDETGLDLFLTLTN